MYTPFLWGRRGDFIFLSGLNEQTIEMKMEKVRYPWIHRLRIWCLNLDMIWISSLVFLCTKSERFFRRYQPSVDLLLMSFVFLSAILVIFVLHSPLRTDRTSESQVQRRPAHVGCGRNTNTVEEENRDSPHLSLSHPKAITFGFFERLHSRKEY